MIELFVIRDQITDKSTCGRMLLGAGLFCYTLEPITANAEQIAANLKPRAISCGTYDLVLRYSPKHKEIVPWVTNVPGFEDVEIHVGNFPKDTLGCTLVGTQRNQDQVSNSRVAFLALMAKLNATEHELLPDGSKKVGTICYEYAH